MRDILVDGDAEVIRLVPEELALVIEAQARFRLDFDDAYQYVAFERRGLTLVSFDGDFDRTERGRTTPDAILAEREAEPTDDESYEG
ncbi:MAG: hypothetical protein O3A46_04965 [Candidatus Poribacteria bacterium]|nr:hypothetical protein [Candidatus Poribacteria bacterium]